MRASILFTVLASLAASVGCINQGFCAKRQQCDDKLNADSERVCVADLDSEIAQLRANKEAACQELADAILNLNACAAGLSCSDFNDRNLGGQCDDQKAKLKDAQNATTPNNDDICASTH